MLAEKVITKQKGWQMNLLKDAFISTTVGKVSLKDILTNDEDYQLQYFFDETQLAMLQMLSSLATVVLKPTISELKGYIEKGLTPEQYDKALSRIEIKWFEDICFMRSKASKTAKEFTAPVCNLVSGIESSSTGNASGLFSNMVDIKFVCPDCTHVLNYNLHTNIKGDCFGSSGATGIRGGGSLSTLLANKTLKGTLLANMVSPDHFNYKFNIKEGADNRFMWDSPLIGDVYSASNIGLERGLFALAYHISFDYKEEPCLCDVCGSESETSVTHFKRAKYKGSYGSTKKGRDAGAGWWPHPYTPVSIKEDGIYPVSAQDQNWQSWQQLAAFVIGKETEKATLSRAYIVSQFSEIERNEPVNLLIGGNITSKASIIGRVYDLYSMPSSLSKNNSRISQVIDSGLEQKEKLSVALNKMFGVGYDKHFVGGIKNEAMQRFTYNAQQIVQQILLDVDRKEAIQLRKDAISALANEAKAIFKAVQRKYQHDLPLFKALVKGEYLLHKAGN
jgi:CRISPR system Cascade subunit CasA